MASNMNANNKSDGGNSTIYGINSSIQQFNGYARHTNQKYSNQISETVKTAEK